VRGSVSVALARSSSVTFPKSGSAHPAAAIDEHATHTLLPAIVAATYRKVGGAALSHRTRARAGFATLADGARSYVASGARPSFGA
jgi:hypothetical protein